FAAITRGCIVDVLLFSFQGSTRHLIAAATFKYYQTLSVKSIVVFTFLFIALFTKNATRNILTPYSNNRNSFFKKIRTSQIAYPDFANILFFWPHLRE
ncbi:hypothetical protein, partial [Planococcus plakortidis]|uniref:hypothetical protein n=1 Tax=Planococcus plakortidis TaxID=1038856 RepID=UPI0039850D04